MSLCFIRYSHNSIECFVHLMNAMEKRRCEVFSMEKLIAEAGLKSIDLLLFLLNDAEDSQKREILSSISQFITVWVTVCMGDVFACAKPDTTKKELQVNRSNNL